MSDDFQQRGGSPWGTPPGGGNGNGSGRGPTPPDIDKIIREIQNKIKNFLPGGSASGSKPVGLILLILVFVWLASGLYRVLPDEQGVVIRFGKFIKTTQPGLNYHIPFPVETVETPKVTKVNRIDIGFRSERDSGFSSGGGVADVPQESLMLTGDENIVNIVRLMKFKKIQKKITFDANLTSLYELLPRASINFNLGKLFDFFENLIPTNAFRFIHHGISVNHGLADFINANNLFQ